MKKNIAVLAGGNSSEFFISLKSAEAIAQHLNKEKYNVFVIQIKEREWILTNDLNCGIIINKNDFSYQDNGQKETFDCILSAIHGTPGEDGLLQAYFDMLEIPYVGSGVLASSLTFNKYYCNSFVRDSGIIKIADSVLLRKGKPYDEKAILAKIGLPCFVKPNAGGSSFGVSKVKTKEQFAEAVHIAFKESDEVIAEQYIAGAEIQCGIYKTKTESVVLPLVEIVSKNEFFDYQAKYDPDFSEEIIPARISETLTAKCQDLTSQLYDAFNLAGIARMDFILKDDEFWFLEANTIPGMTNESIVPQMLKVAGIGFGELLDNLIEDRLSA